MKHPYTLGTMIHFTTSTKGLSLHCGPAFYEGERGIVEGIKEVGPGIKYGDNVITYYYDIRVNKNTLIKGVYQGHIKAIDPGKTWYVVNQNDPDFVFTVTGGSIVEATSAALNKLGWAVRNEE